MVNIDLEKIFQTIKDIIENLDFRLYDINFNEVSRVLRIFIDKAPGGVTINDCKRVSLAISSTLDNLINCAYTLEVSSPGVERRLTRPEHYQWAMGNYVEIDLANKKIRGHLRNTEENGIIVATEAGEELISYDLILKAKVAEEIAYGKRR